MPLQFSSDEQESSETFAQQEPATVLLVDDSRELLEVLRQILEVNGYRVMTADRVEAALFQLTKRTPDIIICDVMMPGENGYTLHREVQLNPEWCTVPFVFLTALASDEEKRLGIESGCDDYLTKPFDPDDLVAVVKGKLTLSKHRSKMAGIKMEGFRRRIIHTLSHEFRTPLVSINTGTELLLDQHRGLNKQQVSRLLESVWRGGQRLERLVDDFMLLQQIDLGHAEHTCKLYSERCPVPKLVESAIETFNDSLLGNEKCDVEVLWPSEEELSELYVSVYDVQISNVLLRLLSNAYKFAGSDKPITIAFGKCEHDVFISVRDRGPGIEHLRPALESACEPFTQINRETFEQQGCGLGLTIARHFVKINGGTLSLLTPESGEGLEALILFPKAE